MQSPTGDYQWVVWEKKAPELSSLLGCKQRQLLSCTVAHRLDTGGNAMEKQQREVAGAKRGGLEDIFKNGNYPGFQHRLPGQQPDQHMPGQCGHPSNSSSDAGLPSCSPLCSASVTLHPGLHSIPITVPACLHDTASLSPALSSMKLKQPIGRGP